MIRVLVVDDSPLCCHFVTYVLERDPDIQVVGKAETGCEAIELAKSLRPDLITMDIGMPDMDGLEATRRIMNQNPTRILILSQYMGPSGMYGVSEAMKAGAMDVVVKASDRNSRDNRNWTQELLKKVKSLACIAIPELVEAGKG